MFSEVFIKTGLKVFGRILIVTGALCFIIGAIVSVLLTVNQTIGVNGMGLGLAFTAVLYGFILSFLGFIGCGIAYLLDKKQSEKSAT